MIGYTLIGTNDLPKAEAFYTTLFEDFPVQKIPATDRIILWMPAEGGAFGICTPADGNTATNGNGTMIALPMPSNDAVDAIYAKALSLGASSAGEPVTGESSGAFYGGYIRDFDNNKIAFYHLAQD